MDYLKVLWRHESPDYPVEIYSELDDERWETRKVEVFPDGHLDYSDGTDSTGRTDLSEVPLPSVDEIVTQDVLSPMVIDEAEFDRKWQQAVDSHGS